MNRRLQLDPRDSDYILIRRLSLRLTNYKIEFLPKDSKLKFIYMSFVFLFFSSNKMVQKLSKILVKSVEPKYLRDSSFTLVANDRRILPPEAYKAWVSQKQSRHCICDYSFEGPLKIQSRPRKNQQVSKSIKGLVIVEVLKTPIKLIHLYACCFLNGSGFFFKNIDALFHCTVKNFDQSSLLDICSTALLLH